MADGKGGGKKAEENAGKSRASTLRHVKQESLRKISFLEHKAVIDYRDVYRLVRQFFMEYLGKRYEFTVSELRKELDKTYLPVAIRQDVMALLNEIERMEYSLVTYDRAQLIKILERFRRVVEELVKSHSGRKTLLARIRAFIYKEEDEPIVISELPVIENDDDLHVQLKLLLEQFYLLLDQGKTAKAKRQYTELLQLYNGAPETVRREFYVMVDEAYNTLLDALMQKK